MKEKRGRFLDIKVWKRGIMIRLLSFIGIGASITQDGDFSFVFSVLKVNIGLTLGYFNG